ncbi:MAG: sugar phosphate isomerase/epimerase family protein [Thermoplasmatota archaeon]
MPFKEALDIVKENFDGWEFLAEKYHSWEFRDQIEDHLSTVDMEIQIHSQLNDVNIASINPTLRKASINEIEKTFKLANSIDVKMVTVHPGIYSPLSIYWDETAKTAIESLNKLKIKSDEYGVTVAMENLPKMWLALCSKPEETRDFLDETGLDFCLDVGHAYTSDSLDEFLEFKPVNLHLHDNVGEEDSHLALGDGEIDFEYVLDRLESYQGNYVIEGRAKDELIESKKYLKGLLDDTK